MDRKSGVHKRHVFAIVYASQDNRTPRSDLDFLAPASYLVCCRSAVASSLKASSSGPFFLFQSHRHLLSRSNIRRGPVRWYEKKKDTTKSTFPLLPATAIFRLQLETSRWMRRRPSCRLLLGPPPMSRKMRTVHSLTLTQTAIRRIPWNGRMLIRYSSSSFSLSWHSRCMWTAGQ